MKSVRYIMRASFCAAMIFVPLALLMLSKLSFRQSNILLIVLTSGFCLLALNEIWSRSLSENEAPQRDAPRQKRHFSEWVFSKACLRALVTLLLCAVLLKGSWSMYKYFANATASENVALPGSYEFSSWRWRLGSQRDRGKMAMDIVKNFNILFAEMSRKKLIAELGKPDRKKGDNYYYQVILPQSGAGAPKRAELKIYFGYTTVTSVELKTY